MSQSITIAIPLEDNPRAILTSPNFQWANIRELSCTNSDLAPTEIMFRDPEGAWYISLSETKQRDELIIEYLDGDYDNEAFLEAIEDMVFLMVFFDDYERTRRLVELLFSNPSINAKNCWIDNDYGVILNGQVVLNSIERDPLWDWRTDKADR